MNKTTWKIIAIVFITIFILQIVFNVWSYYSYTSNEKKIYECYYDICESYPEAYYKEPICYCYDYDVLGDLIIVEEEYLR